MHYLLRHIKCSGRIILLFNHCFVFPAIVRELSPSTVSWHLNSPFC
nr:MAG TPA: hypothetical protein [Caudoviricetes sp.]DAQ18270.1 MAG TPA: hypothetical protein [Caudoviricetes sp.]DAW40225.1 MAG TPA: hypothetical protein [Caudoviricetes sp.]